MDLAILTTATLICLATLVASWGLLRRLYRDVYTIFVSLRLVSNVRRICSEEKLVIDLFEDVVSQVGLDFCVSHLSRELCVSQVNLFISLRMSSLMLVLIYVFEDVVSKVSLDLHL